MDNGVEANSVVGYRNQDQALRRTINCMISVVLLVQFDRAWSGC
jgi:hypothetical protein